MFSAFLLQMVCLGASALGLMTGRGAKPWHSEGDNDLAQRRNMGRRVARRLGEDETLVEINLLLTSYSGIEFEADTDDSTPIIPRLSLDETVRPITNLLSQLADKTPNRWTVAALLTFATSPVPTSTFNSIPNSTFTSLATIADLKSRYESAQPILVAWAWRAFYPLLLQESPRNLSFLDYHLLKAFTQYLIKPSTYYRAFDFSNEILDEIINFILPISPTTSDSNLSLSPIQSRTIKTVQQKPLYLNLIALCLQFDRFDIVLRLLHRDSPLEIPQRLKLAERTLSRMSLSKEMSRDTARVEEIGRLFFLAVQDLTVRNSNQSTQITPGAIKIIEAGIKSYLTGFTVSIATECLAYETLLHVLKSDPTVPFSETFLTTFFNHFVGARNPSRAFTIFNLIPKESRTLSYYNILLRTHHAPTSQRVYLELRSNSKLSPNLESYEARMISHSHQENNSLDLARNDIRVMTIQYLIEPNLMIQNQLLKILVALGKEKSMHRYWTTVEKRIRSEVSNEKHLASFNIRAAGKLKEMSGRNHLEKLRNGIIENENKFGWKQGIGSTADGVTKNIILKVMTRSKEVQSKDLIKFTSNSLGIDLTKDIEEVGDDEYAKRRKKEETESDRKDLRNREFATKTLIRAFKSRGETQLRNKLIIVRAREKMMRETHKK